MTQKNIRRRRRLVIAAGVAAAVSLSVSGCTSSVVHYEWDMALQNLHHVDASGSLTALLPTEYQGQVVAVGTTESKLSVALAVSDGTCAVAFTPTTGSGGDVLTVKAPTKSTDPLSTLHIRDESSILGKASSAQGTASGTKFVLYCGTEGAALDIESKSLVISVNPSSAKTAVSGSGTTRLLISAGDKR